MTIRYDRRQICVLLRLTSFCTGAPISFYELKIDTEGGHFTWQTK